MRPGRPDRRAGRCDRADPGGGATAPGSAGTQAATYQDHTNGTTKTLEFPTGTVIATAETWRMQVFGSKGWVRLEGMTHVAGAASEERRTRLFGRRADSFNARIDRQQFVQLRRQFDRVQQRQAGAESA